MKSFFDILRKTDQILYWLSKRPHIHALLWFLISIILYGIGAYGDYFEISKNPFKVHPEQIELQDAILLPLIAYYTGLNIRIQSFLILCFIILLASYFVYAYLPARTYGKITAAIILVAFAVHPLMLLEFNGLGSVDGVTLIVSAFLAFTNSAIVLFVAGLIGAINHPQILIIAPLIIVLRLAASDTKFKKSLILYIFAGILIGSILVRGFIEVNDLVGDTNRFSFMYLPGIDFWLNLKFKELPQSIFTLYGSLILVIISSIIYGFRRKPIFYLAFIAVQIIAWIVTLFTFDTTRVFGLLTLPSILLCIAYTMKLAQDEPDDLFYMRIFWFSLMISAVFMPKYYAFGGRILLPKTHQFWEIIFK